MELIIAVLLGIAATCVAVALYYVASPPPAPVEIVPVVTMPVEAPRVEPRPTPAELAATARAVRERRAGDPDSAARELIAAADRGIEQVAADGRTTYIVICDSPAVRHRVATEFAARGFVVSRPAWDVLCIRWDLED